MKHLSLATLTVAALLVGLGAGTARATTYYIDFDAGADTSNGTTPGTAFKHCPGDAAATGTAGSTSLAPGDTVIFKGGVTYRSSIVCNASGAAGNVITYDGNTAGTFGTGRAIVDGADRLTGWVACTSAADCGGNPNWDRIYKAAVPAGMDVFIANMYENDMMLWPAQDPNVTDPFFTDDLATFRPIHSDNVTRTSLTDPSYFTQTDPNYYDGAYLRLWGNPNVVRTIAITGFVPSENKITFADTGENSLYTNRTVYYAVANHIMNLDVAGEFVVDETTHTAYLWPRTLGDPNTKEITMSTRRTGFKLNGRDHVTVQGFRIQKHTAGAGEWRVGNAILTYTGGDYITIRDNEMTRNFSQEKQGVIRMYGGCNNVTIDDNDIFENPHNRGMILTFTNSVCSNNRMRKNGGTAIDFYGCIQSQMIGNTVTENTGVHANGLTLYLDCRDCLVAYNTVFDGNVALTLQDAYDITVAYNVFHTDQDTYTATDWGRSNNIYYYNNVMINPYGKSLNKGSTTTNVVVRNNVLDGCGIGSGPNISHNIYTDLFWNQSGSYGWSLGTGESIQTDTDVFVDPANRDFRLKNGSPAIDAGTDLGLTQDHDGHAVPYGSGPDIGAYEYGSTQSPAGSWSIVATHGAAEITTPLPENYVEPRTAGIRKLTMAFDNPLDPATVTTSIVSIAGQVSGDQSSRVQSVTLEGDRTLVIVLSTALPNADWYTVAISTDLHLQGGTPVSGDLDIRIGALVGDVNGSGAVAASDVVAVRALADQALDAANAHGDVDGSGGIVGTDLLLIRQQMGTQLP